MTIAKALGEEFGVPVATLFQRSCLRHVVDMGESESAAESQGPFEVVQERPHEVAVQREAACDGFGAGVDVLLDVGAAVLVFDVAVGVYRVGIGGSVLGDVERQLGGGRTSRPARVRR